MPEVFLREVSVKLQKRTVYIEWEEIVAALRKALDNGSCFTVKDCTAAVALDDIPHLT